MEERLDDRMESCFMYQFLRTYLPSTGLYTTPTDVENIIAFLIENEYVISGEVDDDGLTWFDARTDID